MPYGIRISQNGNHSWLEYHYNIDDELHIIAISVPIFPVNSKKAAIEMLEEYRNTVFGGETKSKIAELFEFTPTNPETL